MLGRWITGKHNRRVASPHHHFGTNDRRRSGRTTTRSGQTAASAGGGASVIYIAPFVSSISRSNECVGVVCFVCEQKETGRLKRHIHEMETFLADYGLIWVGYRAADDSAAADSAADGEEEEEEGDEAHAHSSSAASAKPTPSAAGASSAPASAAASHSSPPRFAAKHATPPVAAAAGSASASAGGAAAAKAAPAPAIKEIYFDMKKLMACVTDLNAIAGAAPTGSAAGSAPGQGIGAGGSGMVIVSTKRGASFQTNPSVPITFFKNGLSADAPKQRERERGRSWLLTCVCAACNLGMFFKNGPLRPYSMVEAQNFVNVSVPALRVWLRRDLEC